MGCCCCISVFAVGALLVIIVKVFLKLSLKWNDSATCLVGKTAIVTGANTGIGFYTAQDFAKRGARVILACRNKSKAEEAKIKIINATGNPNVVVKLLDLTSLASVRRFAKEINETEENLHILVNNAGVIAVGQKTTEDGLDLLSQVNHFGPFLLTLLLIDLMKKSEWGRIVNVSSSLAHRSNFNINDLGVYPTGRFSEMYHYSNSKVCNILFTNELAIRLRETGIQTNSLHPGIVDTEIIREYSPILKQIFALFGKLLYKTAEEGAQTTIYLAVSKRVDLISGQYFDNCGIARMPGAAKSRVLARKVWEKSEEFVKLTSEERVL